MAKNTFHVVVRPRGWVIRRERTGRVVRVLDSRDKAIREATRLARREGADVVIHGRDEMVH